MRRRTFGADGDPVEAEDVLVGDELGEYRSEHPRATVHQMRWPDYADEEYERFQREKDGDE